MVIEVYAIVEKSTDEVIYVGSTQCLKKRIPGHISKTYKMMSDMEISKYIREKCPERKNFNDTFEFVTLFKEEIGENKKLKRILEQSMIDKYRPKCNVNKAYTTTKENNEKAREWRNREENANYFKEWHEKHPDWYKDWNAAHPNYQKEWRAAHPHYHRDWQRNHPGYSKEHAARKE